jgi:hypothetical protein
MCVYPNLGQVLLRSLEEKFYQRSPVVEAFTNYQNVKQASKTGCAMIGSQLLVEKTTTAEALTVAYSEIEWLQY